MSFSVTKGEGLVVFTATADTNSKCPLLCQILKLFCCSPTCSVSGNLRKMLDGPFSSLATVQIMVGLLTIGLGSFLLSIYDGPYYMYWIGAPYWLGACFIASGVFTLFGQRFSSPCLVCLTAFFNLVGAILAVVAIVVYAADEGGLFFGYCQEHDRHIPSDEIDDYGYHRTRVNLTDVERHAKRRNLKLCRMYKSTVQPVSICLKVLLLATAALQLCVCISATTLAIKALKKNANAKEQLPEVCQPLIHEEVTANPLS